VKKVRLSRHLDRRGSEGDAPECKSIISVTRLRKRRGATLLALDKMASPTKFSPRSNGPAAVGTDFGRKRETEIALALSQRYAQSRLDIVARCHGAATPVDITGFLSTTVKDRMRQALLAYLGSDEAASVWRKRRHFRFAEL